MTIPFKWWTVLLLGVFSHGPLLAAETWVPEHVLPALELAEPEWKSLWTPLPASADPVLQSLQNLRSDRPLRAGLAPASLDHLGKELLLEAHWLALNGNVTAEQHLLKRLQQLRPVVPTHMSEALYRQGVPGYLSLLQSLSQAYQGENREQAEALAQRLLTQSQQDGLYTGQAIAHFIKGWSQVHVPASSGQAVPDWLRARQLAQQSGMWQLETLLQAHVAIRLDQPLLFDALFRRAQTQQDPFLQLELLQLFSQLPSHVFLAPELEAHVLTAAEGLRHQSVRDQARYHLLFNPVLHHNRSYLEDREQIRRWAESLLTSYAPSGSPQRLLNLSAYLGQSASDEGMRIQYFKQALIAAQEIGHTKAQADLLVWMAQTVMTSDPVQALAWLKQGEPLDRRLPSEQRNRGERGYAQMQTRVQLLLEMKSVDVLLRQGHTQQALEEFLLHLEQNPESLSSDAFTPFMQSAPQASVAFALHHLEILRAHPEVIHTLLYALEEAPFPEALPLLEALMMDLPDYGILAWEIAMRLAPDRGPGLTLRHLQRRPLAWPLRDEMEDYPDLDHSLDKHEVLFSEPYEKLCTRHVTDPHPVVRYFCLRVLKNQPHPSLFAQVRTLLSDANEDIRDQALLVLLAWRDPQLWETLLDLKRLDFDKEESPFYQELLRHTNASHVPQLEAWLQEADPGTAMLLLRLLVKADPQGEMRLSRLLRLSLEQALAEGESFSHSDKQRALDLQSIELLAAKPFVSHRELWEALLSHPSAEIVWRAQEVVDQQQGNETL